MDLIQLVAALSKGFGSPESYAKASGQEQNLFSTLLQSQQHSDFEITAKPQTESAPSLPQDNPKPRKPGQNWTSETATAGLLVVPVVLDLAKVAVFSAANSLEIAAAPLVDETTAKSEGHADQPPSVIPARSSATSLTRPGFTSFSDTFNAGTPSEHSEQSLGRGLTPSYPKPAGVTVAAAGSSAVLDLPQRVPLAIPLKSQAGPPPGPTTTKTAMDVNSAVTPAKSDTHVETSEAPITGGLSLCPEMAISTVSAKASSAKTDLQPFTPTVMLSTSQSTPPFSPLLAHQTPMDFSSTVGSAKSDVQSESSTASPAAQPFPSQPSLDLGSRVSELATPQPAAPTELVVPQQSDASMPAASQATTMPITGGTPTDEITADQITSDAARSGVEQPALVTPAYFSASVSQTERPSSSPNSSSRADLATTSGTQRMAAAQTSSIPAAPAVTTRLAREPGNKSATANQQRQRDLDSERPSPEIVAVSPFHDVAHVIPSPAEAQGTAPPAIASDPRNNSGEPRMPSGQERSATPTLDGPAQTTPTGVPQTAPPAPFIPKTQDATEEELTGVAAANLVSQFPKPQQVAGVQSGAARAEGQPLPEVTREQFLGEMPNTGVVVARMVEGIGSSEMHIGLRTQAFGTVDVHTAVRDTQLGLAVNSERGDLRSFLSSEVPSLQTTLRQHDLHLETIKFIQQGSPSSGFSGSADSHSRAFDQNHPAISGLPLDNTTEEDSTLQDISLETPVRLSVHA